MNNQNQYILFYSANCSHSQTFLNMLQKNPGLYNKFIKISVDDRKYKLPSFLTVVPTLVIPSQNGRMILTNNDVFKWLESKSSQSNTNNASNSNNANMSNTTEVKNSGEIQPYFSSEMGGYSDQYSYLENANPMSHSFAFLGDGNNKINTPKDEDLAKKDDLSKQFERFKNMRDSDVP